MDDRALAALVAAVGDSERFGELLARLQASPAVTGAGMGATAAAMLQLMKTALEVSTAQGLEGDKVLDTMATSMARLTPDMSHRSDGPATTATAGGPTTRRGAARATPNDLDSRLR